MKIYDCFTFFNELDLLEIRLNELDDVVDYFVLVESTRSFQNNQKPCNYLNNLDRFKKFNDKIIRLEVPENMFNDNIRANEENCWNYIINGLSDVDNDDIIMVGALDEIPEKHILKNIINDNQQYPICIFMKLYYYYLNTRFINDYDKEYWPGTYITKYSFLNKNNIYNGCVGNGLHARKEATAVTGGWHFSSLGDGKNQKIKINNFGHDYFNHMTEEDFNIRIEKLEDPFGRSSEFLHSIETIEHLPIYVQQNIEKFNKYIRK
jgi:beta-1,4-mannosyl-glycoprotein beta-1,4-N-acetylglucosaminyltransferase